jgi:hypothetical protein
MRNLEKKRAYMRKCYAEDPEKYKARERKWRANNYEKWVTRRRAATLKYRIAHPEKIMWVSARSRARKHKLPFDITPNDIFVPAVCPVLGIVLQRGKGRFAPNSPSLDRFIPEKGYVRGNIVVISCQANLIKTNSTPEQVMQVARWMRAVVLRAL